VWWDNGEKVSALTDGRFFHFHPDGKVVGKEVGGKALVVELTDWLRQGPGVEEVAAVGFAVLRRNGP
jgi:hypothetical protein